MSKPDHGTYARSVAGCELRCDRCAEAKREYSNRRSRLIAYGKWQPWTDAEPVRVHVKNLQAAGIGTPRISRAAGVGQTTLNRLLWGEPHYNRPPTVKMRPEVADRILAVSATTGPLAGVVRIDATGTRRRLQALICLGWNMEQLGARIGVSSTAIHRALRNEMVTTDRAAAVSDLYDRLWDSTPSTETPYERTAAAKARNMAAAKGWVPPMAWDDDTIDDPAAQPAGASTGPVGARKLPADDDLLWLVRMGETDAALAVRFGVAEGTVKDARLRVEREARKLVTACP
jgi:hypothetical protein